MPHGAVEFFVNLKVTAVVGPNQENRKLYAITKTKKMNCPQRTACLEKGYINEKYLLVLVPFCNFQLLPVLDSF